MFVELMPLLAGRTVLITVARVGCKVHQETVPLNRHANKRATYLCGLGWRINLRWIPREQNEECDVLSRKKSRHASPNLNVARASEPGRQATAD